LENLFSRVSALIVVSAVAAATSGWAQGAPAKSAQPFGDIRPMVHFESVNDGEPWGDRLSVPRRLAATVVAADNPSPKLITDVGSHQGEFLEAFMQEFPTAKGQWTEPVEKSHKNALLRLGRFGHRVSYVIGCGARDISLGCVSKGTDVLITSWLSIHQDLPGIQKFYKEAADMLPSGGWVANIDHVRSENPVWSKRFAAARQDATKKGLTSNTEGPGVHHADFVTPTLDDQIAALKAAGIDDVQVVWREYDTVLIMGRKR